MPDGGKLRIEAKNVNLDDTSAPPLPDGRYIEISVQDEGVGIKPQDLPNIFDPYFTTKQKGSGLGLATAYSVMKRHQGDITVKSQVGRGTTFHIYLPATDKPMAESDVFIRPHSRIGKGKVLVMDHKELVLNSVRHALTRSGYEVEVARIGEEAVQKYRRAIEAGRTFDVVILDLTVPAEMGGRDALKELMKIDPHVKAIASSGCSNDPVLANYETHGFCDIAIKPYGFDELNRIVYNAMTRQS